VKKKLIYALIGLVLFFGLCCAGFAVSKSRSFQFFGNLTQRVDTKQKVVALTFDDAPGKDTKGVLEKLDKFGVKATFFAIGWAVEQYPSDAEDIVSHGHELGNHSYSHERMVLKTPSFIASEIERTNKLIRQVGYRGTICFRPPNGKKLVLLPWYLKQHNMQTIMWDIEPNTYPEIDSDTDKIVDYTVKNTKPGSIILLHPFGDKNKRTRDAIPRIIDSLQKQGYRFVTVSELMSYKGK
jgi:chitin deacetylase